MSSRTVRAATYGAVALLAFGALRLTPPAAPTPAGRLASITPAVVAPTWRQRTDTLGRGESLRALLGRVGFGAHQASEVLQAAVTLDHRRIPAGLRVESRGLSGDSLPSEIVLHLAVDRLLRLRRDSVGTWAGAQETLAWRTDTIAVAGTIRSTLYQAMDEAAPQLPRGARAELSWSLADIFEYRVDMSRELQVGDRFRVLVEREVAENGVTRMGNVLAASFTLSGDEVEAVRFGSGKGKGQYYDQHGKSLRAAFLRAPLEFRRISSVFGRRRHPVLGVWKSHKGTDYAASSGTPVRAIGEGVVVRANYNRGYGNVVEIRHRNGYVTRYGHLRGFVRGLRVGRHVSIGETIAYVGSTGMSTGPHLHFEVLVGGVQRDPRAALASKTGFPIAANERGAFDATRRQLMRVLETAGTHVAVGVSDGAIGG